MAIYSLLQGHENSRYHRQVHARPSCTQHTDLLKHAPNERCLPGLTIQMPDLRVACLMYSLMTCQSLSLTDQTVVPFERLVQLTVLMNFLLTINYPFRWDLHLYLLVIEVQGRYRATFFLRLSGRLATLQS